MMSGDQPKDDNKSRTGRGLKVVEAVAQAESPLSIAAIAQATGLPRATTHRLVAVLDEQGYLQRDIGGRDFVVGPRLSLIARAVLASSPEQLLRHAVLETISAEIGETCNLTVPADGGMIYFDRVETKWPLRHQILPVGSRVPLHCTASGKLFLSSLAAPVRDEMIRALPLEKMTPNTLTTAAALKTVLDQIADTEIGVDDEEFIEGMVALAVPIRDARGRLCATLAFHAPTMRMSMDEARRFLPVLEAGAQKLSTTLG